MSEREVTLVIVFDEDVIGHIEQDHGNWALVTYSKGGIRRTVAMSSDEYYVVETIVVDDSPQEEDE